MKIHKLPKILRKAQQRFILKRASRVLFSADDQDRGKDFYQFTLMNSDAERYARIVGVRDNELVIKIIRNGIINDISERY